MSKLNLAVIFGGQSSEHEVSCMSAANIIDCIDTEKYNLILVGITKEGRWLKAASTEEIRNGEWRNSGIHAVLLPDAARKAFLVQENGTTTEEPVDVIFPALHGLYGEDGTIQGLFELAQIPYVGGGVLCSAVSMDKLYTKIIVDTLGIRQAEYVGVHRKELKDMNSVVARVEAKLDYPVFVKPSCAGSSVGVNKAENREELKSALTEAARHDQKILVEETIIGREIECGILGGAEVKASGVGEILPASDAEFYDYDAKYNNAASKTDVRPQIPEGMEDQIREAARKIFIAVDGCGLARVDFFLTADGFVFNEINTLPGFTAISMYPMLWAEKGLNKAELVQKLIDTAFTRVED